MTSGVTAQLILIQGDTQHFQPIIHLSNTNVSIGRAWNCNVVWGALPISRQHASLEYLISKWFIRDTSTNGLSVNGKQLVKGELFPLNDLDIISFLPTGTVPTVRYRFKYASSSVSATSLGQNNNLMSPLPAFPSTSTSRSYANAAASSSSRNWSIESRISSASSVEPLSSDNNHSDSEDSNHSDSLLSLGYPEDYLYGFNGDDDQSPAVDLESSEEGAKRKHNEDSSDSDRPPTDRKKKKIIVSSSEDESSKDDDDYTKAELPTTASTIKFKHSPEPESTLMSDEQVSKCNDIETLKAQLKSYIFKAGKAELQLEDLKMDHNTEREEFHKKEKEAKSSNAVFKEETYKKLLELMESELSCPVCNEVFIQATVIECGHTFCSFCIGEWSRTKQECPICRKRFTSRCRHIQMENFIIKMFESFNEEITSNRQTSILDRENQVKRAEEEAARAQTADQIRGIRVGRNFYVFIRSTAEGFEDFLPGPNQINEILAPRPRGPPYFARRGGAAGVDRRRSARLQERAVGNGVAPAVEQGAGSRLARRGRRNGARPNQ